MQIVKQAQENPENVVMVGTTGPGRVTMVDSLRNLTTHDQHDGRVTVIVDCPEIACG